MKRGSATACIGLTTWVVGTRFCRNFCLTTASSFACTKLRGMFVSQQTLGEHFPPRLTCSQLYLRMNQELRALQGTRYGNRNEECCSDLGDCNVLSKPSCKTQVKCLGCDLGGHTPNFHRVAKDEHSEWKPSINFSAATPATKALVYDRMPTLLSPRQVETANNQVCDLRTC